MKKNLNGYTIVITGGSSGIGAAAAKVLHQMGAQVVITGRSAETEKVAKTIGCDYYIVDYAKLSDVRRFAVTLIEKYPQIDVLVNNVGGIIGKKRLTEDGHDMALQVNHLAGFLLTNLLRDRLEKSKAVIINTSSVANTYSRIDFSDLENERLYSPLRAYGAAKLMNILHAMELNKRFKGVSAVSFHPGGVATRFSREGRGLIRWIYETPLKKFFLIPPEKGADTLIWLILGEPSNDWKLGEYYYRRKPGRKNLQANSSIARQLWEASEKLISQSPPKASPSRPKDTPVSAET